MTTDKVVLPADAAEALTPHEAPDPANSYERADPEHESPEGKLHQKRVTPARRPDRQEQTVAHRQNAASELDKHVNPADTLPLDDAAP